MLPLILASSSPYRRQLLSRLGIEFECISPDIDESAQQGETASELALRLASAKAAAIAANHQQHLVIASDQVATLGKDILCKPGNRANAIKQLSHCSGRRVTFYTGLCLLNSARNHQQLIVEPFTVEFRTLTPRQIERYLDAEQPYDCAGSFKMEGLGISLFKRLEGNDPNALIGLPLIQLTTMLNQEGVNVP